MKKDILISSIVIIVLVAFIILLNSIATKQNTQKIERERIEKIKQDSIARAEFIRDSITEFQKRTGLYPDGCTGPKTYEMLKKYGFKY